MKILIVDDDPNIRTVVRLIIEHHGHQVIEAGDGQEGFERVLQHKPDAVICDGLMPKMDGFQFLRAVKRDETLSQIPFVFYTAIYTGEKDREFALSLGADALIVKPKRPDEFWNEFTAALEAHAVKRDQAVRTLSADSEEEDLRNYSRMVASKLEVKVRELEMIIAEHEQTKAALQQSEEGYRLLFESNPSPIWVYDLETLAFLAVNEAAVRQYGYSRHEFLSMTIKDIRPPGDVPAFLTRIMKIKEGKEGGGQPEIWRHQKKSGTIIEVEIIGHTLTFAQRRSRLVLANDVTERIHLVRLIRNSANEWKRTFDAMRDAIALLDGEDRILRCNSAMATLLGKQFTEIVGGTCSETIYGGREDLEACPSVLARKTLRRETRDLLFHDRWFEVTADPLIDDAGKFIGAVHIMMDITERKQLEDALKAAVERAEDEKAKSESIIAAIGDGITIQDRDFKILYQNQAAINMIGDHVGEPCYLAYEKREQRCEGCPVAMVYEDGEVHTTVRSAPTGKGIMYFEITASPLRDSTGNIMAGIEVVHNITERKRNEEALRTSEERHRLIFQGSPVGIFHYDTGLIITDCNERFIEILKTKREKLIGLDMHTLRDQRVLPTLQAAMSEEEGRYEGAYTATTSSAEIWVSMRTAPLSDQKGNVKGGVGIVEDITERKKLEEQIFRTKQDWEYTFNSITDMVTVHDKDYNIILANKAAEKILGLPFLENEPGSKCFKYYHGTSVPPEGCPSCGCLQTGLPATFEIFEPHLKMFIEIRSIPRFDSNNQLIGLIHVVRDITERKKSEETIARYSKELTALNMASDTLMLITNLRDIYEEICNIIYSVFDLKMVWIGVIEKGSFEIKPVAFTGSEEGYLSSVRMTWDDSAAGNGPSGMAIKTKTPHSTTINDPHFAMWKEEARKRGYLASLAVPLIYARDKCLGALNFYSVNPDYFTPDRIQLCQIFANQAAIAIENVRLIEGLEVKVVERTKELEGAYTELQTINQELVLRREEADAGSRSKSDFLANMSHELRTPLNAVIGLSQVLLEQTFGPLTVKQMEYLEGVRQAGNHLLALINDILDLSKIEAGKEQFEPSVFSMSEMLLNAFMLVKEKAMKHGVELSREIGQGVGLFYADERRVKQILFNLLSNAVKFTGPGGKVGLKAHQDGKALTLTVWDTGIGIPESKKHLLFQPFQQLDSSLSRQHVGTGLGLALSKRLVEMHGGSITFGPREGGGTSFIVTLPVVDEKRRNKQLKSESALADQLPANEMSGKRKKALIVEDNQLNMLLAADFLKTKAFEVVKAKNGEAALEMIAQERPDIILLEIQLPGINGFEVLRRLRETPVLKDIPVMAMTSLAMKGDEERCMQAGFSDYISKPLNLHEMLNKINGLLESGRTIEQ